MLFKDVIGQEHVKQQLIEMVQQNRLSHALLFLGKEGSGALPRRLPTCHRPSLSQVVCLTFDFRLHGSTSIKCSDKKTQAKSDKARLHGVVAYLGRHRRSSTFDAMLG